MNTGGYFLGEHPTEVLGKKVRYGLNTLPNAPAWVRYGRDAGTQTRGVTSVRSPIIHRYPTEHTLLHRSDRSSSAVDDRFPVHDVDSLKTDLFPMLCIWSLALVAGWEPCNLHDLCSTCFLRWMLYRANPARPITTASEELDDLGHDLSDLSDLSEVYIHPGRSVACVHGCTLPPYRLCFASASSLDVRLKM